MKCYAIKLPNGLYLKNSKGNRLPYSGDNTQYCETDDVNNAKHYKSKGIAEGTLKRLSTERIKLYEYTRHQTQSNWCAQEDIIKTAESYKTSSELVDSCTVVEVDVDTPSCIKTNKDDIKFFKYDWKYGTEISNSQANCYCKCCGIMFKQIKHFSFGKGGRICPFCVIELHQKAEGIIKEMPEDFVKAIEVERFSHRL